MALRQEIWSVLLYRRPFRLPLCPDNDYTSLDNADDYVWTNRIFVWTADVLKYCFGSENSLTPSSGPRTEHWDALKKFEATWETMKPPSFKPTYYCEANAAEGRHFPEAWYMSDCQILGLQHFELARTLLAVYNPRLPRLGLGATSLFRALEAQIRRSTLRLCGLALSNPKCPAAMVTAAVGVSLCGEYFHDSDEQDAIVRFITKLEDDHAWPTKTVVDALRDAWQEQRRS